MTLASNHHPFRIAAVVFSSDITVEVPLQSAHNQDVLDSIEFLAYHGQLTKTAAALRAGAEILRDNYRDDAQRVVFVLTDGMATDAADLPAAIAELHEEADKTFVLGVGEDPDFDELISIASDPENILTADNFVVLDSEGFKDEAFVDVLCNCLPTPTDIVFVIDSSASVSLQEWDKKIEFMQRTIADLNIDQGQAR